MSTEIRVRKAANLSPGDALALIDLMQSAENHAVLSMQASERDLQCLLDIYHAMKTAGHESIAAWWKRDLMAVHSAIWKADQAQRKRGM